jgi:hypothetical protein
MSEVIKKDYGIPVAEFGALFLILGGFLLAFFMRAKSSPMIPATDPKLIDALSSGH